MPTRAWGKDSAPWTLELHREPFRGTTSVAGSGYLFIKLIPSLSRHMARSCLLVSQAARLAHKTLPCTKPVLIPF